MTDTNYTYSLKPLPAAPLSKSKFVHGMQCPLYVWHEVRTDLPQKEIDAATQARFDKGNEVGELARQRWDNREVAAGREPGVRVTDDPRLHRQAIEETRAAIESGARVIHEAAFTHNGVKVRVDVLERLDDGTWCLNEVKSSARYSADKHLWDAAVQTWVARGEGLSVTRTQLVHLNSQYVWPGGPYDLERLFAETDVTEDVEPHQAAVGAHVDRLLSILASDTPPTIDPNPKCTKPYECPYIAVCPELPEPVEHPISELPKGWQLADRLAALGRRSLLELSEVEAIQHLRYADGREHTGWLNAWRATLTGERIITPDFREWVASLKRPIRHLDFETVNEALPVVIGTRPYQQVPLQYSMHIEIAPGELGHTEFLADADDPTPMRSLVAQMLEDLGDTGSIVHWSDFEAGRIVDLRDHPSLTEYRDRLNALLPRLADLGKAVDKGVFQREFHGSWSIKKVLPAILGGEDMYGALEGTSKGDQAADALAEYLRSDTTSERRAQIRRELLAYCELDTLAQVKILDELRGTE